MKDALTKIVAAVVGVAIVRAIVASYESHKAKSYQPTVATRRALLRAQIKCKKVPRLCAKHCAEKVKLGQMCVLDPIHCNICYPIMKKTA